MPTLANTLGCFKPPQHTPSEWERINAEVAAEEDRQRQARVAERIHAANIPAEFQDAVTTDERLCRWATKPGYGLILTGLPGRGKTYEACALLEMAASLVTVRFSDVEQLKADCRECWNGNDRAEAMIARYASYGVLVLDDVGGKELPGWASEVLFEIINKRGTKMRPIIITTNYQGDALAKYMAAGDTTRAKAIASRLLRYESIPIEGKDRRLHD